MGDIEEGIYRNYYDIKNFYSQFYFLYLYIYVYELLKLYMYMVRISNNIEICFQFLFFLGYSCRYVVLWEKLVICELMFISYIFVLVYKISEVVIGLFNSYLILNLF